MLEQIRTLYRAYYDEADRLERERKFGEGLLGIGRKPADDPCHEKFVSDLSTALASFAKTLPGSSKVRSILKFIYRAPIDHKEPVSAYWTLIAAHGATLDLIPLLSAEDAEALRSEYAGEYRRWERMPVQKQVLVLLEKQVNCNDNQG